MSPLLALASLPSLRRRDTFLSFTYVMLIARVTMADGPRRNALGTRTRPRGQLLFLRFDTPLPSRLPRMMSYSALFSWTSYPWLEIRISYVATIHYPITIYPCSCIFFRLSAVSHCLL